MSNERKELGKITRATYGMGGYQDAQFGLSISMEGAWGVSDFWGFWAMEPSKGAKWTKADQLKYHGETADRICKLLEQAKVSDVSKLVGIPVEATFSGMSLSSWRVLEEVL
jgi:hypothetical protein